MIRISYDRKNRLLEYVSYADLQLHIKFVDRNNITNSSKYSISVYGDSNVIGMHKIGQLTLFISHDRKAYRREWYILGAISFLNNR